MKKRNSKRGSCVARLLSASIWILLCLPARADFICPRRASDPQIYGFKGGIVIAPHPHAFDRRRRGGPRGLLRIGYEEDGKYRLINYIAVEPLVNGRRGYSELEKGGDGEQGKRFLLTNDIDDSPDDASNGVIGTIRETPRGCVLRFFVHVERFKNDAEPIVEVSLFERWPKRVRFRTFSAEGGKSMQQCALTSTMGNQLRCRHLWLRSGTVFAPELYSDYRGDAFAEEKSYDLSRLHRTREGDIIVVISPDEANPADVSPAPPGAWHYTGRWLAQFWLYKKGLHHDKLHCRVNGRRVYWSSKIPIPGGISFENFELREPYREGGEMWFGYTERSPHDVFEFPYALPLKNGVGKGE